MISLHTPGHDGHSGHGDHAGHGDAGGYGRAPIGAGVQEEAYHEAYHKQDHAAKHGASHGGPVPEPRTTVTTAGCEVRPDLHPVMRTNTRYGFVMEYLEFWRNEKIFWTLFVFWIAAAIFTFTVFPIGSLLMFALAARFRVMAGGARFISQTFGVQRTIMTVD